MRPGGRAWAGLAVGVIAADAWLIHNGQDSMSTVFGDSLSIPTRRLLVAGAWGILTAHLFAEVLPIPDPWRRYDPIGYVAKLIPRKTIEALEAAYEEVTSSE